MNKCFYAVLLAILPFIASAAPGDSTWVQATSRRFDRGNGYGAYDTAVAFPSGSAAYRKIYMIFTLGKYACPGYNPNNAGEGPGQTGWCGDWDYTVQNILMTPGGDTVELGRLITPYARENWPRTPLSFTRRYIYDVTDYYPMLKGAATMRVFYSGYSTGFSGDIKFLFIEGTPERNVLGIDKLWRGDFNYGHGSTPINTALGTLTRTAPTGTQSSELKMTITGHGGDGQNCAEFCPNAYSLSLNGNALVTQPFFRSDCSENDLYPQSGTWIYARAGWCPGAVVNGFTHKLNGVSAGTYNVGMSFPSYTSAGGGTKASYTIASTVMHYGTANKTLDASLEDIIAPTDAEYHWRENPQAIAPRLTVRNTGGTTITSIKFEYGVEGRLTNSHTWTGNIPSFQNADITLPALGQLRLAAGTYGFRVRIADVNGTADGDALNNSLSSTFTAATEWPAELQIQFRTTESRYTNTSVAQTAWKILDKNGAVVKQNLDCPINTVCDDTMHLQPGAYRLVVTDSAVLGYYDNTTGSIAGVFTSNGLSFNGSTGFFRVYDVQSGQLINLRGYFNGNFGAGFTQDFIVGGPLSVGWQGTAGQARMELFPNPANARLSVAVEGLRNSAGTIYITDMLGKIILQQAYAKGVTDIPVAGLSNGVYLLRYEGAGAPAIRLQQRFVIAR